MFSLYSKWLAVIVVCLTIFGTGIVLGRVSKSCENKFNVSNYLELQNKLKGVEDEMLNGPDCSYNAASYNRLFK